MFGYSEWMKCIRRLLKSCRTSGSIVISEISSHINDATGPLYCPVHNIQEQGFLFYFQRRKREREPHGPFCLFTSRMGMGATRCACPLQEAGLAKLSLQETQRLGLVQRMAELPSIRLLLDICAPHQPDRPTSTQLDLSKKKTNLFIYLNPHVSLSMWVDSPL